MKKIVYSAPGKVILSGEHAVVYGKPALVSAVNLRLKLSVWEDRKRANNKNLLYISDIIKKYLKKEHIKFIDKYFSYKIDSQIPVGRGLGSSAALSVATAAAFLELYTGKIFTRDVVNKLAYLIEEYFHKTPSGVDNSISCYGGIIYYRKELEFLKSITELSFKIPVAIEKNLFLIDSGKPKETTKEMVELVKQKYENNKLLINKIFEDIEKKTKLMTASLKDENNDLFMKSVIENEVLLEQLGVVSDKTTKLLVKLKDYGEGKVCGAGGKKAGSGFLLFYSNNKKGLTEFCLKNKLSLIKFRQSNQGLKKEL